MKLLRILTTPSCWLRNLSTGKHLDAWMIKALEKPNFSQLTEYTVLLNGKAIWIGNFPYYYGWLHYNKSLGLPSRSTAFALFDALSAYTREVKA